MTTAQKIIVSSSLAVLIGVIVFSDFTSLKNKIAKIEEPKDKKLSADGTIPDPYMMIEVNPRTFPNASGNSMCLTIDEIPLQK